MIQISLCMIVKDEEKVLERCLASVADLMDEIVVVDTGSTDKTKEIAKKYTDKIYDFKWVDDFSAARNFAFSHASKDYVLSMDADEVLEDLSDTREVVIRAYSDDGSYEERTVADPGEVREICDTVLALKMKVTRFKTLKNVVYEVRFVGTDGETIDTLAVAPGNDLVGITETTFRIKSDFDILEYARNLFAAAAN